VAFNFLKNPFERLSSENQEEMKEQLKTLNESFVGPSGVLGLLSTIAGNTGIMVVQLKAIHKSIIENKNLAGKADKKELDMIGKSALTLGGGMEKIVTAIKLFSKVPDDMVDKFIEGINKLGEAFSKLGDGLKSIEKAGETLQAMAKGIVFFGLALIISGPIYLMALPLAPVVIGVIMGVLWAFQKVLGSKESMEGVEAAGKALTAMSRGIFFFGLALLISGPIYLMALPLAPVVIGMVLGILYLFTEYIADAKKLEKIEQASNALLYMAKAMLLFGIALLLSGPIYLMALPLAPVVIGIILGVLYLFTNFIADAKKIKKIEQAAKALMWMGLAIILFGIALVVGSKIYSMLLDDAGGLLIMGTVIFAMVGIMMLLSKVKKNIITGAQAIVIMAASVIVLAIGMWLFSKLFPATPENVGTAVMIAGMITVLSGAMYVIGLIKGEVIKGAIALVIASVAVIILAFGLGMYNKLTNEGFNLERALGLGGVIAMLAIEVGLMGLAAPFILAGAAAMIAISISLVAISWGLGKFQELKYKPEDASNLQQIITKIPMAFLGLTGNEGLLEGIGKAAATTAIMLAALANSIIMIGISVSLVAIGKGISEFQKIKINEKTFGKTIESVITPLIVTFGKVGKAFPGGSGLFGLGASPVYDGIQSVMGMGNALTSIARGVQQMANLRFPTKYDKDGNPIEYESMDSDAPARVAANTNMIVSGLSEVFGEQGKKYPGGKAGLLSSIFGSGKQSPVADGISAVMGMGDALTGIAQGFQSMANLKFVTGYDKEGKPTGYETIDINKSLPLVLLNTRKIVQGLTGVFQEVGSSAGAAGSSWFSSSAIETGVDIIKGMGEPILNLANGIVAMANLKFPSSYDKDGNPTGYTQLKDKDLLKVSTNIQVMVLSLTKVFSLIGSGALYDEDEVETGVDMVMAVIEPLEMIAEVAKTFSELKVESNTIINDIMTDAFNGIMLFSKLKPVELANVAKGAGFLSVFEEKITLLTKNRDDLQDMNESFAGIAESMGTFKDNLNGLNPELLTETKGLFEAMAIIAKAGTAEEIIAKYGSTLDETLKNLAKLLEDFGGTVAASSAVVAEESKKTGENVKSLVGDVKKSQKAKEQAPASASMDTGALTSALDEIAGILRGTLKVKGSF